MDINPTMTKLNIEVGLINIKAEMHTDLAKGMGLATGKEVYLILKLRRLRVLGDAASMSSDQYGSNY
jgi:hypothetical protein